MDDGRVRPAPRAEANTAPMRLGPVTRPAISARDMSGRGRATYPTAPQPFARGRRPVPVGPAGSSPGTRDAGQPARVPPTRPTARTGFGVPRTGFGLPSLRRNVCPHFYMTGVRGAVPIQAPHLLKALVRQEHTVSRCQLRGGVHLEEGYVNDVCLGSRFNQCVFYEDDLEL